MPQANFTDYEIVSNSVTDPSTSPFGDVSLEVSAPIGKKVVGGGAHTTQGLNPDNQQYFSPPRLYVNGPKPDGSGWVAKWAGNSISTGVFTVYAICAKVT